MKKIYSFSITLLLGATTFAQGTVGFDLQALSPESYDNGSGGSGDFMFSSMTFTNVYDTQWSSWNGFSISNVTDVTTAGFGNQYASFTGGGFNSSNFAVFYPAGTITTDIAGMSIDSLKITNTTYAGISMRDGDGFAKQFGSPNDANGIPDGTNGEDFFKVWIIGENSDGSIKDSVEFYLADYRFVDNLQDYIVDEWINVDFSNFGFVVRALNFRIESSDIGSFGINTPQYFAIDEVSFGGVVGIAQKELSNVNVYPNPMTDKVIISGEHGELTITSINGSIVYSGSHSGYSEFNVSTLNAGIYFVSLVNEKGLFTTKIIK